MSDAVVGLALERLTRAVGTPHSLKSLPFAAILGLASLVGNLERLTLRKKHSCSHQIGEGYRNVPDYTPRDREIEAPDIYVEMVILNVQTQMGITGDVAIGSAVWLRVLANALGQIAAVHGVRPTVIKKLIGEAWEKTPQAKVDEFRRQNRALKQPPARA